MAISAIAGCSNCSLRYSGGIAGSESPFETLPPTSDVRPAAEAEIARELDGGRRARAFLDGRLRGHVAEAALRDAKLVATELVNNAVLHGEGRITFRAELRKDAIRVEVVDEGTGNTPAVREEAETAMGGRGLRIVDALAMRWGVFEGTTHVWADVALAPAAGG